MGDNLSKAKAEDDTQDIMFSFLSTEDLSEELLNAATLGDKDTIERLIKFDINISKCNTALLIAVRRRHLDVVKLLCNVHGIDVNLTDGNGDTPLHIAVKYRFVHSNNVIMTKLLLKAGANVNLTDGNGDTSLHTAVRKCNVIMTELLLKAGANVNLTNGNGDTPLHIAVKNHNVITTELLLKAGANVNCRNNNGQTPLLAVLRDVAQCICKFIKMEAMKMAKLLCGVPLIDVNQGDHIGISPLTISAFMGELELVKLICGMQGIVVNQAMCDGRTPLHIASQKGHLEVIKYLEEEIIARSIKIFTENVLAILPLDLPPYVLLEIMDKLPHMELLSHKKKIDLIISLKKSFEKVLEQRE